MLSDLSFDDYLEAGGWRGYAQKDAFATEARTWLEPLQKMLDTEQAQLQALENTTADDFLLIVAIQRQLCTRSTSTRDAIKASYAFEPFNLARKPRPREFVVLVSGCINCEDFAQRHLMYSRLCFCPLSDPRDV